MLYREKIVICSKKNTKHINALIWQKMDFFNANSDDTQINY